MSDEEKQPSKSRLRRQILRELEQEGFSWFEEKVSVKPPERERAFVLDAVFYRAGDENTRDPFIVMSVKRNPGSWAVEQMLPYAHHLETEYILITDGQETHWFRTAQPESELSHPPKSPGPGSGGRAIDGPEVIEDIFRYFRRVLDLDPEELFKLGMASLLLKFSLDRNLLEFDPTSEASMRKTLSIEENLPEFLKDNRFDLQKKWNSIWGYLNSFVFPETFSWGAFFGWYQSYRRDVRFEDERRSLLPGSMVEFLSDILGTFGSGEMACLEQYLCITGLRTLEKRDLSVTIFEPLQEVVKIVKVLLWANESTENVSVAGTDPVRADIVSHFRGSFDTALLLMPQARSLDTQPEGFQMAEKRRVVPVYIEAAINMLRYGGLLLTEVPERLLAGDRSRYFREYLMKNIRLDAVFTLPAPERTRNRKTFLVGEVREKSSDEQEEEVFMFDPDGGDSFEQNMSSLREELFPFLDDRLDR